MKIKKHWKYTDLKLVLVPLIFILLRMWSGIIDILHYATLGDKSPRNLDDTGGFYALVLLAVSQFLTAYKPINKAYTHM